MLSVVQTVRRWFTITRETFAGMIAHNYAKEKNSLYSDDLVVLPPWQARVLLRALRQYEHQPDTFQHALKCFGLESPLELAKLVGFSKEQFMPDYAWPGLSWYEHYQKMHRKAVSQESPHTTWVDVLIFLERSIPSLSE